MVEPRDERLIGDLRGEPDLACGRRELKALHRLGDQRRSVLLRGGDGELARLHAHDVQKVSDEAIHPHGEPLDSPSLELDAIPSFALRRDLQEDLGAHGHPGEQPSHVVTHHRKEVVSGSYRVVRVRPLHEQAPVGLFALERQAQLRRPLVLGALPLELVVGPRALVVHPSEPPKPVLARPVRGLARGCASAPWSIASASYCAASTRLSARSRANSTTPIGIVLEAGSSPRELLVGFVTLGAEAAVGLGALRQRLHVAGELRERAAFWIVSGSAFHADQLALGPAGSEDASLRSRGSTRTGARTGARGPKGAR